MAVLSNYGRSQETPKNLLLSAIGLVVLSAGLGGFLIQLCSPLNVVGAANYVAIGSTMLFANSKHVRQIGYSYVPTNIKEAMFEKSLIETLSQSSPHWQLLAFFLACVTLPLCDVQGLAKQLPPCFDVHKERSIVECLIIGDKCARYEHGMKVVPPMPALPEKPPGNLVSTVTKDPFTAQVVQAGLHNINKFVVKETLKQIHHTAVSVRETMRASTSILAWIATVGIVGGSVACWWKELLMLASQSHYDKLWSWAQMCLRHGMRHLKRIAHTDIDMPLIALGMISGSAAVLSTREIFKSLNPNTCPGRISAVASPAAVLCVDTKERTSCTLLEGGSTVPLAITTFTTVHSTVSNGNCFGSTVLRLLVALRCCAVYMRNTALEGVAGTTISLVNSTRAELHVNGRDACATYNQKQVVMICTAISVLCARRLNSSMLEQRWLACAVYSKLYKGLTAGGKQPA